MKKIILLFLLLSGCAVAPKKIAPPAGPNVKKEFARVDAEVRAGAISKAVRRLENISKHYANTDAADDANIYLGQLYYKQAAYADSYRAYISVLNSEYFSARELDAGIGASHALNKLGRYDEALSLTSRLLKHPGLSPSTQLELYSLRYEIQTQLGDRLDALRSLVFISEKSTNAQQKEKARIKAIEFVESKLKEDELKTVADDSSFGFVRAKALYQVGVTSFEQHDYSRAENAFNDVTRLAPNSDLANSAKNYLEQLSARRRVEPYTIGAVLPLTGRHSLIAQKTLRGLQMGLGLYDSKPTSFKIAVVDSEANPDSARRGVERLVIEDSVIAIVGDLISKTAEPVAQKANDLGVPNIGLSQKAGLTQVGENVFRNALTSTALVKYLVENAMTKYGMKKFAILFPNDAYGVEYANLFWDEVLSRGGQIVGAQNYSSKEKDFGGVIARLVGTFYLEDRLDEYTFYLRKWVQEQKSLSSRVEPPNDLLPPIVDFDGLFIPDGVKPLGQISSMLIFKDVKSVHLLGTNLWNSPTLISRGTNLIDNSLFVDATNAADKSFFNAKFVSDYKRLFHEDPSAFEAQAYDTGLALRVAIEGGARSRPALRSALASLHGLHGVSGLLDVNESREFSRPLVLLTVKDGKIEPASPPPANIRN